MPANGRWDLIRLLIVNIYRNTGERQAVAKTIVKLLIPQAARNLLT